MKLTRRQISIGAGVLVVLLASVGFSRPGRAAFGKLYAVLGGSTIGRPTPPADDAEKRAKNKQGWNKPPQSAVMLGTITYFDPTGAVARQGKVSLYRQYPEKFRIDIEHQGVIIARGFDGDTTWQALAQGLSERQQRDIRAWLRVFPERLFLTRGRGNAYREVGTIVEDSTPEQPGKMPTDFRKSLQEVEVEDEIGESGHQQRDTQPITYLIDRETSLIYSARWLEPDEVTPGKAAKVAVSSQEVRVDFGNWRQVENILWPLKLTRWQGGRLDWQIELDDVQVNRPLINSLFQQP